MPKVITRVDRLGGRCSRTTIEGNSGGNVSRWRRVRTKGKRRAEDSGGLSVLARRARETRLLVGGRRRQTVSGMRGVCFERADMIYESLPTTRLSTRGLTLPTTTAIAAKCFAPPKRCPPPRPPPSRSQCPRFTELTWSFAREIRPIHHRLGECLRRDAPLSLSLSLFIVLWHHTRASIHSQSIDPSPLYRSLLFNDSSTIPRFNSC